MIQTKLKNITFEVIKGESAKVCKCWDNISQKIVVPEKVMDTPVIFIEKCAFEGCPANEIVLPDSIKFISDGAFMNSSIEKINIPENTMVITNSTFSGCKHLKEITGMEHISSIAYAAFMNCIKLKSINLTNVNVMGPSAFENCLQLNDINIGNVAKIMSRSFLNCKRLKCIDLSKVQSIGEKAFYNCSALEKVIFSESVMAIKSKAFEKCTNLVDFYIPNSKCKIFDDSFSISESE